MISLYFIDNFFDILSNIIDLKAVISSDLKVSDSKIIIIKNSQICNEELKIINIKKDPQITVSKPEVIQEFSDFVENSKIDFLGTRFLHESLQHVNEIYLLYPNKDYSYVIFNPPHFAKVFMQIDNLSFLKKIYLPDAFIFSHVEEKIVETIQFKYTFSEKVLSEFKFKSLEKKYNSFFVDKIKINFDNKKIYYDQYIDHNKFPRIYKTFIKPEEILSKKIDLKNYFIDSKEKYFFAQKCGYNSIKSKVLMALEKIPK